LPAERRAQTADEVVFGESSDLVLLGVRTVEGFGVLVDNIGHRFVAQATTVAMTGDAAGRTAPLASG
jgi:hypothetical protein